MRGVLSFEEGSGRLWKEGNWEVGKGRTLQDGHRPQSLVAALLCSSPLASFSKGGLPATLLKGLVTVGAVSMVAVVRLARGTMEDPQAASRGQRWG